MVLILLQKETCLQNAFAMGVRIPGDTTTGGSAPYNPRLETGDLWSSKG